MNVIMGSVVNLQHTFNFETVLVEPTAVSLMVKMPDNTSVSVSATVPMTASISPIATAEGIQFTQPGAYAMYWTLTTADGQSVINQDDYFAPYSAMHRFVRERLNATYLILPDAPLDSALCYVSRLVIRRLSDVLPSYSMVPMVDTNVFDQALALTAAAYLRPLVPKTVASGELQTMQIGTDKWTYTELAARAEKPLDPVETQWMDEASELIMSCSFVQMNDKTLDNLPMLMLNGTRRHARHKLHLSEHSPLYKLWTDDVSRWAWERGHRGPMEWE